MRVEREREAERQGGNVSRGSKRHVETGHPREVEGIGKCWRKEARELGTVAKEETRMGVAVAECETAEGKCEPER